MFRTDAYSELPAECKSWDAFCGGDTPFQRAQAAPDEWVAAFDLTATEFIMVALGLNPRTFQHVAHAVRYDSASGRYLAWPLCNLPASAGLPRSPRSADVWKSLLGL